MDEKLAAKASNSNEEDALNVPNGAISALMALSACIQALQASTTASTTTASDSLNRTASTGPSAQLNPSRGNSSQRTGADQNVDDNLMSNNKQEDGEKKRIRKETSTESPLAGRAAKRPKRSVEGRDSNELPSRSLSSLEQDVDSGYDSEPCDEIRRRSHDKVVEYMDSLRDVGKRTKNSSSNSNGESTSSADEELTSMESGSSEDESGDMEESDTTHASSCSHFSTSTCSSCTFGSTSNCSCGSSSLARSCGCSSCSGCGQARERVKTVSKEKEEQIDINLNLMKENRTLCDIVENICLMALKKLDGTYDATKRLQDQQALQSQLEIAKQQDFSSRLIRERTPSVRSEDPLPSEGSPPGAVEEHEVDARNEPQKVSRADLEHLSMVLGLLEIPKDLKAAPTSNANQNCSIPSVEGPVQERYTDCVANNGQLNAFQHLQRAFSQHSVIQNARHDDGQDYQHEGQSLQQEQSLPQMSTCFPCVPAISQEGQKYLIETIPDGMDFSLAFQLPQSELASQLQTLLIELINRRGRP